MLIRETTYGSPEYKEAWQIREDVLRKPIGKSLRDENLIAEAGSDFTHVVALDHKEDVVGCLILQRSNSLNVQMRQVAVTEEMHGKGVGKKLVVYAEKVAKRKEFSKIFLHARVTVKEFYEKLGYRVVSEEYLEVGIPHVTMEKIL